MASNIDTDTKEGSMWVAALSAAFCGLMRGGEIGLQDGEAFDASLHLTRNDVKFWRDAQGVQHMALLMRPLKKGPKQRKTVPLLFTAGGALLDPVLAMQRMIELDPVAEADRASTPLFRRGGAAIRVREVRDMVKVLMSRLGLDPARFGAHSLRIGGATAALAAGLSPAAIRAAGRWSSEVYQLYCRLSRQSAAGVSVTIGSTPFELSLIHI